MLLKAEEVCFSYGRKIILSGISFTLERGECIVIAGDNGCGKSTLLSLLCGVQKPKSGNIIAEGKLALVPQGTALFGDMTVGWNLDFFASLAGRRRPEALPFGVGELISDKVSKLSGGQRKRVSLACALMGEPDILLLDEPCAGLDYSQREKMCDVVHELKSREKAVVYVSHDPGEFGSFYDKLLCIRDGKGTGYTRAELSGLTGDDTEQGRRLAETFKVICAGGER